MISFNVKNLRTFSHTNNGGKFAGNSVDEIYILDYMYCGAARFYIC